MTSILRCRSTSRIGRVSRASTRFQTCNYHVDNMRQCADAPLQCHGRGWPMSSISERLVQPFWAYEVITLLKQRNFNK